MMHTPYGYRIVDAKAVIDEAAAKSQNRLGARKQPKPVELKNYRIGRIATKYEDPYMQAEYAYSLIEEDSNE